jgi:hypothetical protein
MTPNTETTKRGKMNDLLSLVAFVAIWLILTRWLLPRLGVPC